jgi:alkylhydroperoxidase family enzyme
MTSTARVPAAEITGLFGAMVKRMCQKRLGEVPESLGVIWHHKPVLKALFGFSGKAEKWDKCDLQLKSFAHMLTASRVGCSWCLDFGYFEANNRDLDMDKAREIPRWRESALFTPLERDVLEYTEGMATTPTSVTDELSARLQEQLGVPALIELTAFIGVANLVTRTNSALGIEAQGFSAACGLRPLAEPTRNVDSAA